MTRQRQWGRRPTVELLEARRLLSATAVLSGSTLTIVGDDLRQIVEIQDSRTAGVRRAVVSIDADGNGVFTDAGDTQQQIFENVQAFDIRLARGHDIVRITLADPYEQADKRFDIDTGNGNDTVSFTQPIGNAIRESQVVLNVKTGNGWDSVNLQLGEFSSSNFSADVQTAHRDDGVEMTAGGFVGNSVVDVRVDGQGGNDQLQATLDWDVLDILGVPSSTLRYSAWGGDGDDELAIAGESGGSTANVYGLLDLGLYGQGGSDVLAADLGQFNLNGGTLKLRSVGGAGDDDVSLTGDFRGSGGLLDIELRGGGDNDILSTSANASVSHTYKTLAALLDGGRGTDTAATSGTLLTHLLNMEA